MTDSYHYSVYGDFGRGLPRDLDGYVHLTAAGWLAAPVDTAGEPMTAEQAESLAEQARAATREAEAAVATYRGQPRLAVTVGHQSSIPGARWCRPVGWSPRNRFDGADWYDEDGAWTTEDGEEAGIVVFGDYDEGETVTVGLDDLRVAQSGDCRVIGEVQVDFE